MKGWGTRTPAWLQLRRVGVLGAGGSGEDPRAPALPPTLGLVELQEERGTGLKRGGKGPEVTGSHYHQGFHFRNFPILPPCRKIPLGEGSNPSGGVSHQAQGTEGTAWRGSSHLLSGRT